MKIYLIVFTCFSVLFFKNSLAKDSIDSLLELLNQKYTVEGEGQDILDIDETLRQCEQNALLYAEQNAMKKKMGIIISNVNFDQKFYIKGKKVKITKNILEKLVKITRAQKLKEEIILKKKEPVKIKDLNTFICKAKVRLTLKGLVTRSQLEKVLGIKKKEKKTITQKIKKSNKKQKDVLSTYRGTISLSSIYRSPSEDTKEPKKYKSYNYSESTSFDILSILGFELGFGLGVYNFYFGKEQRKASAMTTHVSFAGGFNLFHKIFFNIGYGGFGSRLRASVDTQDQKTLSISEFKIYYAKLGIITIVYPSTYSVYLRGELLKTFPKVNQSIELNGGGYIFGFGIKHKKVAIEVRYSSTKNESGFYPDLKVKSKELAVFASFLYF